MLKKLLSLAAIAAAGLCANAQETYDLGLNDLGSGWDSSYDPETKTITFDDAWKGRGWWLGEFDASAYTDVVVECETSTIPVQMVIEYSEGESVTTGVLPAGTTTFVCELDPERKSNLKQIFMQCAEAGTLTLTAAYLIDNSGQAYNPVIWSGSQELSWDNWVSIKPRTFKAGDRIGFVFETEGGGVFSACCVDASWGYKGMTSYSDYPGYGDWGGIWMGQSGAVAAYINASDAANYVYGLAIGGEGLTLTKVLYFPTGTPTTIYVTGDGEGLGNWDLSKALAVEGEFGVHSFSSANLSQFKFSPVNTTDWNEFNTRAYTAGQSVIGENRLELGEWNNIMPWTGDYDVTIDLCALTMTLATDTPEPDPEIYLRGAMNEWGVDPAYLFEKIGETLYRLEGVDIEAGQEFKIADANWNPINYGGATNMEIDEFYTLKLWGDNCSLASSVYNAVITFNLSNGHILITGETDALEVVAAGTDNAVYYNLQGVEVANPSNGIYLKRVGDKVSKVMVK